MIDQPATLAEHMAVAAARLELAGLSAEEARQSASALARHTLGRDHAALLARMRDVAPEGFAPAYQGAIARRERREPVAYITGEREFYGHPFAVTRDVLIPRPETEIVVEEALACLAEGRAPTAQRGVPRVIDIGTGSGCLAVALALECPTAQIVATDISKPALDVALANARGLGVADRIDFRHGSLLSGATGPFDLAVSNPPYIADLDRASLAPEVALFEPPAALFGGVDGLGVIRALVPAAARALAPGGWLVIEMGIGQAEAVGSVMEAAGLTVVRVRTDLQQIRRVAVARR